MLFCINMCPRSLLSLSFNACVKHGLAVYEAIPPCIANDLIVLLPSRVICDFAHKTGEYERILRLVLEDTRVNVVEGEAYDLMNNRFDNALNVLLYVKTHKELFECTKVVIIDVCSFCVVKPRCYREQHILLYSDNVDDADELLGLMLDMRNYCNTCWLPLYKLYEWRMDDSDSDIFC